MSALCACGDGGTPFQRFPASVFPALRTARSPGSERLCECEEVKCDNFITMMKKFLDKWGFAACVGETLQSECYRIITAAPCAVLM